MHRARNGRYDGLVVDAEGVQVVLSRLVSRWPRISDGGRRGAVGRALVGCGECDEVVERVEEARLHLRDGLVRCEVVAVVGHVGDGRGGEVAG